jgi:Superinfection immunity protein
MGFWVKSTNTLVNASAALVVAVCFPTSGRAQDVMPLFRGLVQTAIVQSTWIEWQKLPKGELACIDRALVGRGEDIQQLVRSGIQPSDSRISDIRASCRNQPASRVAYDGGKSPYIVEGLALGAQVSSGREPYSSYDCGPSEQFMGLTWCSKEREEPTIRRGQRLKFSSTYSILHSRDGVALYISRHLKPAWFADNEAQDDVDRLSKNFGPPAHVFPMPPQSSVPNGMIVTWGKVALELLDQNNVSQLAAGHDVRAGLMIDHIGNFQRSAQLGLPIYRLTGGAGYVWAASWKQDGVGTLRFLALDASAIRIQPSAISNNSELTRARSASHADDAPRSGQGETASIDNFVGSTIVKPTTTLEPLVKLEETERLAASEKMTAPSVKPLPANPNSAAPIERTPVPLAIVAPAKSTALANASAPSSGTGLLGILACLFLAVYLIPSLVAFRRRHPNRWLIFVINLFGGLTLFGWLLAMVWACRALHKSTSTTGSDGGESGLNLFVNDELKVRNLVVNDAPSQLVQLKALLDAKAIDLGEYEKLKSRIVGSS